MKIIAITTNFGFGPVSKLCTICNEIINAFDNVEIDFVGSGISSDFMKVNSFITNFINMDSDSKFSEIAALTEKYDLLINVMNIDVLKYLVKNSCKIYFIDSLSMLWKKPFIGCNIIDMYFVQRFFEDENNIKAMNIDYELIEPIVEIKLLEKDTEELLTPKTLLVNFSGLYSPLATIEYYYKYAKITSSIFIELFEAIYDKIIFTCNNLLCDRLNKEYGNNKIIFACYSHDQFLIECKRASKIFSLSGITFHLESTLLNLNVNYLLPSNYSQYILIWSTR